MTAAGADRAPAPPLVPAPLWRRAGAGTVDGVLGWLVSEALIRGLRVERPAVPRPPSRWRLRWRLLRRRSPAEELRGAFLGAPSGHTVVTGLASILAGAPALAHDGRTPGQRAAGIRLVGADGGEAGLPRLLGRQFAPQVVLSVALLARSPAAIGLGVVLAAADAAAWLVGRRTLRDRALGTSVIRS